MKRGTFVVAVVSAAIGAWAPTAGAQGPLDPPDPPRHVSDDGTAVAFTTNDALVAADTDSSYDVYVWRSGTLELASGGSGPQGVFEFEIARDGSRVVFLTEEALVAADTDTREDVYVRDGSSLELASTGPTDPGGSGPQDIGGIWKQEAPADLGSIYFSTVQRMVASDTDNLSDVYRHDTGGSTTLVSTTPAGVASGEHFVAAVTDDGSRVIESTDEAMVAVDTDALWDLYARSGGSPVLVSTSGSDPQSSTVEFRHMTPDGRSIVFESSDRLGPRDYDDQRDLYQRIDGTTRLVSANGSGNSLPCENPVNPTRGENCLPRMLDQSDDGGHVLFETSQMLAAGDAGGSDVYDRAWPATRWLTGSVTAGSGGLMGDVAADGSRAVIETRAKFSSADTDDQTDVYAARGDTRTLLSPGPSGTESVFLERTSRNAEVAYFSTYAGLVPGDTDGGVDLYANSGSGPELVTTGPADGGSSQFDFRLLGISKDGDQAYFSTAQPLVAADTDTHTDVYRRAGGATTLISG